MENKHFISFSLQNMNPDNMPEEVLMSHIRVIAHQLDKDMQYAQSNQEKKFNETKFLTQEQRLKSANNRFSSQKPDLIWANLVQESYRKALNGQKDGLLVSDSKELLDISEDAFTKLIQTRRSVRFYNDSPIDDTLLEKIVSFGLWAPSNCNVQALQYIMVKDPLIREKLEINNFKKEMGYCTLAIICDYRL